MAMSHDISRENLTEWVACNGDLFKAALQTDTPRERSIYEFPEYNVSIHLAPPSGLEGEPSDFLVIPRALYAAYAPYGHDIEASRDQLIADVTGRTVVGITTPGFDYTNTARTSVSQVLDTAVGHGASLVGAQSGAIEKFMRRQDWDITQKRIGLLGYCMGATVAAKLFEPLNELVGAGGVSDLTLIESPNDQAKRLLGENGFKSRVFREVSRPRVDYYLSWNDRFGLVQPFDRDGDDYTQTDYERKSISKTAEKRSTLLTIALFKAATKGFSLPLARYISENSPETNVNLWRANNSEVTPEPVSQQTLAEFKAHGIDTQLHVIDGDDHHHPIFQSLAHVGMIMSENESLLRR